MHKLGYFIIGLLAFALLLWKIPMMEPAIGRIRVYNNGARSSKFHGVDDYARLLIHSIQSNIRNKHPQHEHHIRRVQSIIDAKPRSHVSLIIPCTIQHMQHFNQFYASLLTQTVLPKEIIIGFAVNEEHEGELFPEMLSLLPIAGTKIYLRPGVHFPGDQREFLTSKSEATVLSYFDCDDYMHPQRIDFITRAFNQNPNVDVLLHGFVYHDEKELTLGNMEQFETERFTRLQMDSWRSPWTKAEMRAQCGESELCDINHLLQRVQSPLLPRTKYPFAHGWISNKKSVFETIKLPNPVASEDLKFTHAAIYNGFTVSGIDQPLGLYTKISGGARPFEEILKNRLNGRNETQIPSVKTKPQVQP